MYSHGFVKLKIEITTIKITYLEPWNEVDTQQQKYHISVIKISKVNLICAVAIIQLLFNKV